MSFKKTKKSDLPKLYISHAVICDSKRLDGSRDHFKQAVMALIAGGYTVAAYEKSTDQPTRIFKDSRHFEYWYENFVRIQGWEVPEISPVDYKDHSDYFNCATVE
jgi:hypothetical protein